MNDARSWMSRAGWLSWLLVAWALGCNGTARPDPLKTAGTSATSVGGSPAITKPPAAEEHPAHAGHDDEPGSHAEGPAGAGDEHGAGGEEEVSDLDRPVEELKALACEHGIPTYLCPECRYEVGFAQAPTAVPGQRGATSALSLIRTATVEARVPDADLVLTGEVALAGDRTVHAGPRAGGTIRSVRVDLGSRVVPGDMLLEIDSREIADAKSVYLARVSARSLASRTLSRERSLAQQGISAGQERWAAQAALEQAEIDVRTARDTLVILGIPPEEVEALERSSLGPDAGVVALRASLPGTVVFRHAALGETVETGDELLVISDLSAVWVWADVRGSDMARILSMAPEARPSVRVTTSGLPGAEFLGTLDFAAGEVAEETRTLRVRATVQNPGERLRPGMFVRVALDVAPGPSVLAVPAIAVLSDEGRDFVFVRDEGDFFVRRPVTVVQTAGGWTELSSGPPAGTVVATEGAFLLKSDVLRSKMGAGCAD